MDCGRARELFHDYIDGLLSGEEAASLEEHVARCPSCAAELAGLDRVVSGLGGIERINAPEGFAARLFDRIDKAKEGRKTPESSSKFGALQGNGGPVRSTSLFFRVLPLAAAAVFIAALVVVFTLTEGNRSENPSGLAEGRGAGSSDKVAMKERKVASPPAASGRSRKSLLAKRKRPQAAADRLGGLFLDKDPRTGAAFDCLVVRAGSGWKGLSGSDAARPIPAESIPRERIRLKEKLKDLDTGGDLIEVYEADAARFQDLVVSLSGRGAEAIYGCTVSGGVAFEESEAGKLLDVGGAAEVSLRKRETNHGGVVKGNPPPVVIWTREREKIGRESSFSGLGGAENIEEIALVIRRELRPREEKGMESIAAKKGKKAENRVSRSPGTEGGGGRRILVLVFRESAPREGGKGSAGKK